MSQFLDDHPGGRDIILANRSHDVTRLFGPRHPRDALEPANLPDTVKRVGPLRATDAELAEIALKMSEDELAEMERMRAARDAFEEKGLGSIINMRDFERAAEPLLSKVAWAYYASAGDDEISELRRVGPRLMVTAKNANADAYQRVLFRPRVLRKVGEADARTDLVGCPTSIPVFIAPAAMAKLGHPLGEINLTRGAGSTGVIQAVSSVVDSICDYAVLADPTDLLQRISRNGRDDC
jgi:L-lactate dehydrogenase (cytochrome)